MLLGDANPTVRELALIAAGNLKVDGPLGPIEAMGDRLPEAVRAARLRCLALLGREVPKAALDAAWRIRGKADARFTRLSPLLSTFDPTAPAKAHLCDAVASAGLASYLPQLHEALDHSDIRVRIHAARAVERLAQPSSVPVLLDRLGKSSWPTKVALLSALGAIPDSRSVEPLIGQLEKEPGRLRLDVNYALASVFARQAAQEPIAWRDHWASARETFAVDREASARFRDKWRVQDMRVLQLGDFYRMPVVSDRFAYVIDVSMSMKGPRIADVKAHMEDSVVNLDKRVLFNIVTFGGQIVLGSRSRLIAPEQRHGIRYFLENLKLNPPTRSYDALIVAGRIPGIDTLLFLSDGAPVSGQIAPWQSIIAAITYHNRYRPLAIWTIEFDAGAKNAAMMKILSDRNYALSGSPEEVPEAAAERELDR